MKDYFFNTRDDFHYDHSGYYGYIVFNGDTKTRDGLLNALGQGAQPGGLGWYRYGKSFRPANDGKMYNWYIRLHSGGNDKPAAQAVDDFLRRHLKPEQMQEQPESQKLVQDLFSETLGHYEKSVAEIKQGFSELKSEIQASTATKAELEELRSRLEVAEEAKERAEQARAEVENALNVKQAELEATQTESPGDQFWHQKYNESEATIQKLKKELKSKSNEVKPLTNDLKRLQRDYSDITSVHADTLRAQDELAQVLERLKDHDRHISEDLTRLQQDVRHIAERDSQDNAGVGQPTLLTRFVALEQDMSQRMDELQAAVQAGTAAQAELQEMRSKLEEAEEATTVAEQSVAEAESVLEVKQAEIATLQNEGPGDQFWHQKYNESETTIQKFKKEKGGLENEVKTLTRNLKQAKGERDNYSRQFLEASKLAGELQKKLDEKHLPDLSVPRIPSENNMSLAKVVDVFLPDVDLVQDSWNNLIKMDFRLREKMLGKLRGIVWDPRTTGARRVAGADGWMELREGDWRLYYCRKRDQNVDPWHRAVILIGRKVEQEKSDIPWLKTNPAKSFFE